MEHFSMWRIIFYSMHVIMQYNSRAL